MAAIAACDSQVGADIAEEPEGGVHHPGREGRVLVVAPLPLDPPGEPFPHHVEGHGAMGQEGDQRPQDDLRRGERGDRARRRPGELHAGATRPVGSRLHGDASPGRQAPLPGQMGGCVVPVERIELPTFGLQNRCTTAVLHRPAPLSIAAAPEPQVAGLPCAPSAAGNLLFPCRHIVRRHTETKTWFWDCPPEATNNAGRTPPGDRGQPVTHRFSHSGLGTACFALLLGSTLLVAAPAAAAPGERGRPAATAPAATGQAAKKLAVAEADAMTTSSMATSSLTKATDEEPACDRPRRRLWVEGEGWVVRRVSACH